MKFPPNIFTAGTDNDRAFRWLQKHGRITTKQLHAVVKADTARIREIRSYFRKSKRPLDISCREIQHEPRNCVYEVRG